MNGGTGMSVADEYMIVIGGLSIMLVGIVTLMWSIFSPETIEVLMGIIAISAILLLTLGVFL